MKTATCRWLLYTAVGASLYVVATPAYAGSVCEEVERMASVGRLEGTDDINPDWARRQYEDCLTLQKESGRNVGQTGLLYAAYLFQAMDYSEAKVRLNAVSTDLATRGRTQDSFNRFIQTYAENASSVRGIDPAQRADWLLFANVQLYTVRMAIIQENWQDAQDLVKTLDCIRRAAILLAIQDRDLELALDATLASADLKGKLGQREDAAQLYENIITGKACGKSFGDQPPVWAKRAAVRSLHGLYIEKQEEHRQICLDAWKHALQANHVNVMPGTSNLPVADVCLAAADELSRVGTGTDRVTTRLVLDTYYKRILKRREWVRQDYDRALGYWSDTFDDKLEQNKTDQPRVQNALSEAALYLSRAVLLPAPEPKYQDEKDELLKTHFNIKTSADAARHALAWLQAGRSEVAASEDYRQLLTGLSLVVRAEEVSSEETGRELLDQAQRYLAHLQDYHLQAPPQKGAAPTATTDEAFLVLLEMTRGRLNELLYQREQLATFKGDYHRQALNSYASVITLFNRLKKADDTYLSDSYLAPLEAQAHERQARLESQRKMARDVTHNPRK